MREELDRERDERNFFQLERDKVNSFWEITKRQLEEARSTVRNKERELEDSEERHQVEIKVSDDVCSASLSLHNQWEYMLVSFPTFPGI